MHGRRRQTDDRAVGGRTEGEVDVDTDQVALHALGVGQIPCPVVGLLEQPLAGAAHVEAGQMGQNGMPVDRLARCRVHRLGAQ